MPRDPTRRRSRRSLPSAIERNLSLHELLADEDRHARKKRTSEAKAEAQLQQLSAYFAMIDQTELEVEKVSLPLEGDNKAEGKDTVVPQEVLSDSELQRPASKRVTSRRPSSRGTTKRQKTSRDATRPVIEPKSQATTESSQRVIDPVES
ncbi:hypothetical protein PINS_up007170 [Pythium insidiosum]|nr:hypothetical protein PINS_up007170 [Pythium insidiosum]